MAVYRVQGPDGHEIDASFEVQGSDLVFLSRGGTRGNSDARNVEYAKGLTQLLRQLSTNGIQLNEAWVDSRPAQRLPLADRQIYGPSDVGLVGDSLVKKLGDRMARIGQRPGAKGGNPTKRIRLRFRASEAQIREALRLDDGAGLPGGQGSPRELRRQANGRLAAECFEGLEQSHVLAALEHLDRGDPHAFGEQTTYDLHHEGRVYPPKAVFGLAASLLLNQALGPSDFSAGEGQPCFRLLRALGFSIEPRENHEANVDAEVQVAHDLCRLVEEQCQGLPDDRNRPDGARHGSFWRGWQAAVAQDRAPYGAQALSRVTWESLGYRTGQLHGAADRAVADRAFERFSETWERNYYAPTEDREQLEQRAAEWARAHQAEERPQENVGSMDPPEARQVQTKQFQRSPGVVANVRARANGHCDLCQAPAPFRRQDGTPYLEVHHITPLAEGGLDHEDNAVALCPNCHRRCHYSVDRLVIADQLRVSRRDY